MVKTEHVVSCDQLVAIFNRLFKDDYRTVLVKGGLEPEYIPSADSESKHKIIFTRDYFSSALHEIAHWCIAGDERRLRHDYGYWYRPDGRNAQEQAEFESVEVKPQALEWLFSSACGIRFLVSADNVSSGLGASPEFKQAIVKQAHAYCEGAINKRSRAFIDALYEYYHPTRSVESLLKADNYVVEQL